MAVITLLVMIILLFVAMFVPGKPKFKSFNATSRAVDVSVTLEAVKSALV